jgi:hypothetical protein
MRRWPCSTNTTLAMMARPNAQTPANTSGPELFRMLPPSIGTRAAIEAKISSDMPLPTPRSVTCSPSHMITAVPAVITMTMIEMFQMLPSGITGRLHSPNSWPWLASATMPVACRIASAMVR